MSDSQTPKIKKGDLPEVRYEEPHRPRKWPRLEPIQEYDLAYANSEFTDLDPNVPLLLLPVRLETRLDLTKGKEKLHLRIYPDQLHVQKDDRRLSDVESDAGHHFWEQFLKGKPETQGAALDQLIRAVGPRRAGYVLEITNPDYKPDKIDPNDLEKGGPPRPKLVAMPERWIAIGYVLDQLAFVEESSAVLSPLETSVLNAPDQMTKDYKGVPVTENSRWMLDFENAKTRGMGMSINLGTAELGAGELTNLVVFGVTGRLDKDEAMAVLEDLLEHQERGPGIGFLRQGAPTNNTRGEATDWTFSQQDRDRLLAQLRQEEVPHKEDNAAQLRQALGLRDLRALSRARHSTDTERMLSRAMNTVLFETVFGRFLRELLPSKGEAIPPEAIEAFRGWMIEHVTGGAPLPTVRVGAQPYGILPVLALQHSRFSLPQADTVAQYIENTVTLLKEDWLRSLDQVPLLDPNVVDRSNAYDQPTSDIPALLASQPHPARLFSRALQSDADETLAAYALAVKRIESRNPDLYALFAGRKDTFDRAEDIDTQIAVWGRLYLDISNTGGKPQSWKNRSRRAVDGVLAILGQYEQRQRPLKSLHLPGFEGTLGGKNSAFLQAEPSRESTEITSPPLVRAAGDANAVAPSRYLSELAGWARQGVKGPGRESEVDWGGSAPDLLYQLILDGFEHQSAGEREDVAMALELLAEQTDPKRIELLARETLGLASHRLDAWYTSLANRRLADMRKLDKYRYGISLGCYGWISDLKFEQNRRSGGFIHAPSLSHSATAAVLRSGWMAHGSPQGTSPAAVDLGSSRIRLAKGLLDGVRNGQSVGFLLGQRFERALRDAEPGLASYIRDIRVGILALTPESDATADEPIDGLRLLELFRGGRLQSVKPFENDDVLEHVKALEAVFDAVHDLALFEGTHAATQGRSAQAKAVFEAINHGIQLPPEFRSQRSARTGASVEHRLVLVLPKAVSEEGADDGPGTDDKGWKHGHRDAFAPEIEAWLRHRLPSAHHVGLATESGETILLSQLNLSALDALALVSDDPAMVSGAMQVVAAGAMGVRPEEVKRTGLQASGATSRVQFEEFQLLANELRGLLDGATPLDAAGLLTGDEDAVLPHDDAREKQLFDLLQRVEDAAAIGDVERLARFGLAGPDLAALQDRALRGVEKVREEGRTRPLEERLALILGRKSPVSRYFVVPDKDTPGRVVFDNAHTEAARASRWLEKVGLARPAVGRLTVSEFLSDLMGSDPLQCVVGQAGGSASDPWAGTTRPHDDGGRLSVFALTDGTVPRAGAIATGLMIDQWSERVPAKDQITGVTFHFDAPSTRAPQSWLLAVPPPDTPSWRMFTVAKVLFETMQFAALRMVQPEDLADFGSVLPTIYARDLKPGEDRVER